MFCDDNKSSIMGKIKLSKNYRRDELELYFNDPSFAQADPKQPPQFSHFLNHSIQWDTNDPDFYSCSGFTIL